MPYVQELALTGGGVARPKTGQMITGTARVPKADWVDMKAILGRDVGHVIREFIRWYLRRPGARLPVRPSPEDVEAALKKHDLGNGDGGGEG